MNRSILMLCLLLPGAVVAASSVDVSALVRTSSLQRVEMVQRVTGYGSVLPEPTASVDLNLPRSVQVTRVLVNPGQTVKKGQTLMEFSADPAALLSFGEAENALAFAKNELARLRALYARHLATRSQVDAARKALGDAEQVWAAQIARGNGERASRLAAPFGGLVTAVAVAQGDRVQAGAELLRLAHITTLRAQLGIEPEDSRQLRVGMPVRLVSVFEPRHAVAGTVAQIAGQIDAQTQLVGVIVRFAGASFLPGSRVRGDIAVARDMALAVPRSAVLRDRDGAYLFQVVKDKAKRIAVVTGIEDGGRVEVSGSGLLDAPVVSLGNYELKDGMAVREETR